VNEMDEEGALEAARAIRPYLPRLVGPAADTLDRRIAELLNAARTEQVVAAVCSLLNDNETTRDFLAEILSDAPHYRPPSLQPGNLAGRSSGGSGYKPLAGDFGSVLHVGKYVCPQGDYVWYRPAVGAPIPVCPTHRFGLART
jgi:hypothetical protein